MVRKTTQMKSYSLRLLFYRNIIIGLSCILSLFLISYTGYPQSKLLIPMDLKQTDHLKSYGVAFWLLEKNGEVDWLLNYRGGSFLCEYSDVLANECRIRGVFFEPLAASEAVSLYAEVQREDNNEDVVRLEKAPKIAVYVPPGFKPWDDAVTMALEYAEIHYTKVWDEEVLSGKLAEYRLASLAP